MFPEAALAGAFIIVTTRRRAADAWVALALLVASSAALPLVSAGTGFLPAWADRYLYAADAALGLRTNGLGQLLATTPWLWRLERYVYGGLPLAIALAWVVDHEWRLVRSLITGAILAPVLYVIFPAVGPAVAFQGWPFNLAPATTIAASAPRNAFPSMHFGWALMLFVHARDRRWRAATFLYLLLMAVATLGSGEHYAADLVGSVFLVWGVEKILFTFQCAYDRMGNDGGRLVSLARWSARGSRKALAPHLQAGKRQAGAGEQTDIGPPAVASTAG